MENQTNDNLLFEVQARPSFDKYLTLNRVINKTAFQARALIMMLVSAVLVAIYLYFYVTSGSMFFLIVALFVPVLFLILCFCEEFSYKRKMKRIWNSMPESKENGQLRFYRDYFETVSAIGTQIVSYDQVYCVNETPTMYFIRTSAAQAITVDKADLSPENVAFIRSIAPEKPGSRSLKVQNLSEKLPDKVLATENADGELLFETQTRLTFDTYLTLNRVVSKKRICRNLIFQITFSFVIAVVGLQQLQMTGKIYTLFIAVLVPVLFVILDFVHISVYKKRLKKVFDSFPQKDQIERFFFYNDRVKGIVPNGESTCYYDQIYCINETQRLYIIRISAIQFFLIDKTDLSPENAAFIRCAGKAGSHQSKERINAHGIFKTNC